MNSLFIAMAFLISAEAAEGTAAETAAAAPSEVAAAAEQATDAATDAEAKTAKKKKAQKDPNRIICKYEAVTGSRQGKKVCHTAAEWEQMRAAAREYMREIERTPRGMDPQG